MMIMMSNDHDNRSDFGDHDNYNYLLFSPVVTPEHNRRDLFSDQGQLPSQRPKT